MSLFVYVLSKKLIRVSTTKLPCSTTKIKLVKKLDNMEKDVNSARIYEY